MAEVEAKYRQNHQEEQLCLAREDHGLLVSESSGIRRVQLLADGCGGRRNGPHRIGKYALFLWGSHILQPDVPGRLPVYGRRCLHGEVVQPGCECYGRSRRCWTHGRRRTSSSRRPGIPVRCHGLQTPSPGARASQGPNVSIYYESAK